MKEINSLIERAKRYLKSAEILLEEGDYESSVLRTYYAIFYSAHPQKQFYISDSQQSDRLMRITKVQNVNMP